MSDLKTVVLEGVRIARSVRRLELTVAPDGGKTVLLRPDEMTEKRFSRQASLLRGYLCLAACRIPTEGHPVDFEALSIPCVEGPDALLAVWYWHALAAKDMRERAFCFYNAFGSLPGGFEALPDELKLRLGAEAAQTFLSNIRAARRLEDEGDLAGPRSCPSELPDWTAVDFEALEWALLRAHRDFFPV